MEPEGKRGTSEHLLLKGVVILLQKLNQQNSSFLGWPFACLLEIKEETPCEMSSPPAPPRLAALALGSSPLHCSGEMGLGIRQIGLPFPALLPPVA